MKIEEAGLINPGWRDRAPNKSVVATSVVAIVVRPGNPAGIEDWGCLTKCGLTLSACICVYAVHLEQLCSALGQASHATCIHCLSKNEGRWRFSVVERSAAAAFVRRDDVQVITANPKTAGVARWNFLALWGHKMGRGERAAQEFCTQAR